MLQNTWEVNIISSKVAGSKKATFLKISLTAIFFRSLPKPS